VLVNICQIAGIPQNLYAKAKLEMISVMEREQKKVKGLVKSCKAVNYYNGQSAAKFPKREKVQRTEGRCL
jgi:hypothetical protein